MGYRSWIVASVLAVGAVSGCSSEPYVSVQRCDPDAPFPSAVCRAQADAGTDAGDAGADDGGTNEGGASSAKPECAGRCTPAANGEHAGTYMNEPVSLWLGPKSIMPKCCPGAKGCDTPGAVPTMKYRLFKDLVAPPAECEPCECGASEGLCTELPETIEIRAGTCGQSGVSSLPFNGPAGWDGSCSSDGALPAGAMCGGVPCAQSIWSPPLSGPTSEACTPKKAMPSAAVEPADWAMGALACQGKPRDETCPYTDETCYEDPGPEWLQCVYHDGVYDHCPDNFWPIPIVLYPEDVIDDRGCEACSCGEPAGSGCFGAIQAYDEAACSTESEKVSVSSFAEGCTNVNPPGHILGAKSIKNLGYIPGTCSASGGQPAGGVKANVDKAVTFCCSSFWVLQ